MGAPRSIPEAYYNCGSCVADPGWSEPPPKHPAEDLVWLEAGDFRGWACEACFSELAAAGAEMRVKDTLAAELRRRRRDERARIDASWREAVGGRRPRPARAVGGAEAPPDALRGRSEGDSP